MAVRIGKRKREVVQIDADWLLGESAEPTRRVGSRYLLMVLSLGLFGGLVWSWPILSKRWLEWDWSHQLATSADRPAEDVLPILIALNELNPNQIGPLVQELASENSERRSVAFQLLKQRIERWSQQHPETTELEALIAGLQSMPTAVPESILMRGQLAASMTLLIDDRRPNAFQMRTAIESMASQARSISTTPALVAVDTPRQALPQTLPIHALPSTGASQLTGVKPVVDERLAGRATGRISDSVSNAEFTSTPMMDSSPAPYQGQTQTASRVAPEPARDIAQDRSEPPRAYASSPPVKLPPNKVSVHLTANSDSPPSTSTPVQMVNPAKRIAIDESAPRLSSSPKPRIDSPAEESLAGIERLPLENLLNILASTQLRLVDEASKELVRRGLHNEQIELWLEIAQGDSSQRLVNMERLKGTPESYAIPMLTWLAEQSDAKVRRKAISLLGAMPHPESVRSLRMLKLREPDGPIADQINQVLLAVGTNANLRR
jgi:hypothetical protein